MTMPWLASASSHFLKSPALPGGRANEDAGSSRTVADTTSEIQHVRSAIESRFNQAKPTSSPKNPFLDPREQRTVTFEQPPAPRQDRTHRPQPIPPPQHPDRHRYAPRTADPRMAQYEFRLPDPRSHHRSSRREKRYGAHYGHAPPPYYEPPRSPRSAVPPGYFLPQARTPTGRPSPSQWPSEKTPTSAYHPRGPSRHSPRTPGSPKYRQAPVPHTAHPGGSFPRFGSPRDSPREKGRSPAAPDSAPGKGSANGSAKRTYGFFDSFNKVKTSVLSPRSAARTEFDQDAYPSPAYSPIPPPSEKPLSAKVDTRQHGFYEYRTPSHQTHFDRGEVSEGYDSPETPQRSARDITIDVPGDEKVDDDKQVEEQPPKTLTERIQELIDRIKLWFATQLQRRRSRIPSVQPDLESQSLEAIEKELFEAFVLSWTTVAGAWLIQFTTFGYIWSWGVFQDFYLNNYSEAHTSANRVSWIGSLQLMLTFALGLVSGKLFDAGWIHSTLMIGSLIFGMGVFTLSLVDPTKYIQLFLVQGLFMGIGLGLVFLPSALIVQLHFPERKGLMTGIVMSGSSFGAMIYPIMLDKLLPPKGFNGAVRATGYMVVVFLVLANCLIATPPKKWTPRFPPIDLLGYIKEIPYAAACGGIFLVFLTMWFPQYYIEEFAVRHDLNPHLAFYSLALIALGGMAGRVVMGFVADKFGPWNMLLSMTFVVMLTTCLVLVLKNVAAVVFISIIYGFGSGAWLSLLISALSSLAIRPTELGHRTGFALTVGSLGCFLTGSAQAALLSNKWVWARPVGFFAFLLIVSMGVFGYVRYLISVKRRFLYV